MTDIRKAPGRGSDTRIYSPRSESSHMYSANDGDDKYNPTSPEDKEKRIDEKHEKEEKKNALASQIKHIKIKRNQGLGKNPASTLGPNPGLDDSTKNDVETEFSKLTGSAGSRGHMLDMATGAKTGTGSAVSPGLPIQLGEPMDLAWRLLKQEIEPYHLMSHNALVDLVQLGNSSAEKEIMRRLEDFYSSGEGGPKVENWPPKHIQDEMESEYPNMMDALKENARYIPPPHWQKELYEYNARQPHLPLSHQLDVYGDEANINNIDRLNVPRRTNQVGISMDTLTPYNEDKSGFTNWQYKNASEPMEGAWSTLLKRETPKSIQSRRRREARRAFRPSTGQFKTPPGGQNPQGATMRRFRAHMRGIKSGKKTGLMKPHLAVEMSHRGIATKQPMSKDPDRYRQYMAQQEARKILGGARHTYAPHGRYAERSVSSGPTGAGRLSGLIAGQSGQMRMPSVQRIPRPRMPRMPRMPGIPPTPSMPPVPQAPAMPPGMSTSSMMPGMSSVMTSNERTVSDIAKGKRYALDAEMRILMRKLIEAQRKKANMHKSMQGTRSAMENGHVPSHPAGVSGDDDDDPTGPIENDETNAKTFGLDPAGYLASKRGHMG